MITCSLIHSGALSLNESPSEKEGKFGVGVGVAGIVSTLNESPSEKEGKCYRLDCRWLDFGPSMKVPPKRKGNLAREKPIRLFSAPQ